MRFRSLSTHLKDFPMAEFSFPGSTSHRSAFTAASFSKNARDVSAGKVTGSNRPETIWIPKKSR
jgi:hypothetical protein